MKPKAEKKYKSENMLFTPKMLEAYNLAFIENLLSKIEVRHCECRGIRFGKPATKICKCGNTGHIITLKK